MTEKKCVDGDAIGPLDGSCSLYNYGKCNENPCSGKQRCKDCLENMMCGWCEGSRSCIYGSRDGPSDSCPYGFLHQEMDKPCIPDDVDINKLKNIISKSR